MANKKLKPLYDENTCAYWCPNCKKETVLDMSEPHLKRKECPKCKQKIKWSK